MSDKVYSFWEQTERYDQIDVAIIGAGIVGLSTAIQIKRKHPNQKVVVLEKENYPYGASTKNAGFACFGSVGELLDDLERMDESQVIETLKWRWEGLQVLQEWVPHQVMEYKNLGGNEVFLNNDAASFEKCESQIGLLNGMIKNTLGLKDTFSVVSSNANMNVLKRFIHNKYEAQLHPVKMIHHLLKTAISLDVRFFWNCDLKGINERSNSVNLITSDCTIASEKVVLCTNAFTHLYYPDLDIIAARNQVLITSPISNLHINSCYHLDKGYIYFRNYNDRVLLGGARNLDSQNETTTTLGDNPLILDHLKKLLKEVILPNQNFEIEKTWSGIIATGKVKKPIIEKRSDRLYVGVRLGGMGVAIGALVGKKIAELLN